MPDPSAAVTSPCSTTRAVYKKRSGIGYLWSSESGTWHGSVDVCNGYITQLKFASRQPSSTTPDHASNWHEVLFTHTYSYSWVPSSIKVTPAECGEFHVS